MIIIQENQHGKWVDIERDIPRSSLLQVLAVHDARNHKGLRAIEVISTVGPKVNIAIPRTKRVSPPKIKNSEQSHLTYETPSSVGIITYNKCSNCGIPMAMNELIYLGGTCKSCSKLK